MKDYANFEHDELVLEIQLLQGQLAEACEEHNGQVDRAEALERENQGLREQLGKAAS